MVIAQGSILQVEGIHFPVIVISNNLYNETGHVLAVPIMKQKISSPTTCILHTANVSGSAVCDQIRYLDLHARSYRVKEQLFTSDIVEIYNIITSLLDYY